MTNDTKTAILDAAEERFAKQGIHRVSLRAILTDAGINPALANYHFGSKGKLIGEVLLRRLVPLGEARVRLLDELEARSGDPGYTLRDVLWAFTAPAIRLIEDAPHFARFVGQVHSTMDADLRALYEQQLAPSLHRLSAVAKRVLPPELDDAKRVTRAFFFLGLLGYTLTRIEVLDAMAAGRHPAPRGDVLIDEIVTFCEAGILAGVQQRRAGVDDA